MAQVNMSLWRNPLSHSINTISPPNSIKITINLINFFLALDFLNCIHEETDLKHTQANEWLLLALMV